MSALGTRLPFAQELQRHNHGDVLEVECPVCVAGPGEPCCPVSLTIPHLARCREAANRTETPQGAA